MNITNPQLVFTGVSVLLLAGFALMVILGFRPTGKRTEKTPREISPRSRPI
jgi:hypothetical protein